MTLAELNGPQAFADGEPLSDQPIDQAEAANFIDYIRKLSEDADANNPVPFVQGTFALYPMIDGGIAAVFDTGDGPQRARINPGILKAFGMLMGGGSPLQKISNIFGRRRTGR